jgi:hypothetical protein
MNHSSALLHTLSKLIFLLFIIAFLAACNEYNEDIPAPGAYINMPDEGYELEVKDSLVLSPKITYEVNASYTWLFNGEEISTEKELLHISTELGKTNYQFVVKTDYGSDTLSILISTVKLIDFNDLELAESTYQLATPDVNGAIVSEGATFPGYGFTEQTWTGFALSNLYSQSITEEPSPFSAFAPAAAKNNFLIYLQPPEDQKAVFYFENEAMHQISSLSVTNSTLTYLLMLYGTDDIPRFGDATGGRDPLDWFLLHIEGFDTDGNATGEVSFYLADYRFENKKRNYLIKEWSTVDLNPLGKVNEVRLTLSSSQNTGNGEILTLPLICIDNIKIVE